MGMINCPLIKVFVNVMTEYLFRKIITQIFSKSFKFL